MLFNCYCHYCLCYLTVTATTVTITKEYTLFYVVIILTINNNQRKQCTILYAPLHSNETPLTSKLTEVCPPPKMSQRWDHNTLKSDPDCPHSSVLLSKPRGVLHCVSDSTQNVALLHRSERRAACLHFQNYSFLPHTTGASAPLSRPSALRNVCNLLIGLGAPPPFQRIQRRI